MRATHTRPTVVTFFALAVAAVLCFGTSSASAQDIEAESKDWVMSSHFTTGGPFGVVGMSVQGKLTPWLALEAGGGYDTQRADVTGSFRASGRAHLMIPEFGERNKYSLGLVAGLGYDSLEAEEKTSGFLFTSYDRSAIYEDLMAFNGGATLNMVTPGGFRLGVEAGFVAYLSAQRAKAVSDSFGVSEPLPTDFDGLLPLGNAYAGVSLGVVF